MYFFKYLDDRALGRESSYSNYEFSNFNLNMNMNSLINDNRYYVVNEISQAPLGQSRVSNNSRQDFREERTKDNVIAPTSDSEYGCGYETLRDIRPPGLAGVLDAKTCDMFCVKKDDEVLEIEEEFCIVDGKPVQVRKEIVTRMSRSPDSSQIELRGFNKFHFYILHFSNYVLSDLFQ